jgi:hypothetical protein
LEPINVVHLLEQLAGGVIVVSGAACHIAKAGQAALPDEEHERNVAQRLAVHRRVGVGAGLFLRVGLRVDTEQAHASA